MVGFYAGHVSNDFPFSFVPNFLVTVHTEGFKTSYYHCWISRPASCREFSLDFRIFQHVPTVSVNCFFFFFKPLQSTTPSGISV